MIPPDAVVDRARTWLGVRFLHQGRSHAGADCLGFIAAVLGELGDGTALEHLPANYARNPQSLLVDKLTALCLRGPLVPATLILIKFPLTEHPSHAAIFTGESMIHSDQMAGKVVEHSYAGPWLKRTDSIWQLPGVTYQ